MHNASIIVQYVKRKPPAKHVSLDSISTPSHYVSNVWTTAMFVLMAKVVVYVILDIRLMKLETALNVFLIASTAQQVKRVSYVPLDSS